MFMLCLNQLEKFPKCICKAPYLTEYPLLEKITNVTFKDVRTLPILTSLCKNPPALMPCAICKFYVHDNVHLLLYKSRRAGQDHTPKCRPELSCPFHPAALILGIPHHVPLSYTKCTIVPQHDNTAVQKKERA